ncbi:hypothetical protein MFLAVUS_008387 [Mucor flavus]|uniref:Uncharacterized protein n=1 Tax=Mucor flavus TaxID=439312 RepID=A0ABP9Z720_9FUNG
MTAVCCDDDEEVKHKKWLAFVIEFWKKDRQLRAKIAEIKRIDEARTKRKLADTESYCPVKRVQSVPFFSLRPFVLKRKTFDYEETAAGAMKRPRYVPAFIQLTWVTFIKELREKKEFAAIERRRKRKMLNRRCLVVRGILEPLKKVTFADKVQILVFCKDVHIVSNPVLGKRATVVLDTACSYPKKVKTIGFYGLPKTESVLGKRTAVVSDTAGSYPKKVKTKGTCLQITKTVLGKRKRGECGFCSVEHKNKK